MTEELKPVAWMYEIPGGHVRLAYVERIPDGDQHGWTETPLYTRPSTPPAVSDHSEQALELVEEVARVLAKADGLDWDETCGLECPHQPDADECDSSTCIAALVEDHDPDLARTIYLRHAKAVETIITRREQQAAEAMRERAAKKATSFLIGDPKNGIPLRSPSPHAISDAIRALPASEEASNA